MNNLTTRTLGSFSFLKNIEYMANDARGCAIFIKGNKYIYKRRLNYVINYICNIHLTTYKGYRLAIRKLFDFHYTAPLVLSDAVIFIFTKGYKNYENIVINYNLIKMIKKEDKGILIIFKSNIEIYIDYSIYQYSEVIRKINKIKKYRLDI